jgi:hypothetical protein
VQNNEFAWFLATCPGPRFRNAREAVALARKAVRGIPEGDPWRVFGVVDRRPGNVRRTLGVALYRAGDWRAAAEALHKGAELRAGGDSSDWFFLAMAHRQLGDKDEARRWYDKAVEWMDRNRPRDPELLRLTPATTTRPSASPAARWTWARRPAPAATRCNDAAISVTGGTLDLGTAASPGGNTLNINGAGAFVHNTTTTPVSAVGDTFTVNGLPLTPSSLSGVVWEDFNDDGQVDFGEKGIAGVQITLSGTDDLGNAVNLSQLTDSDGAYVFLNLRPGNYYLTETPPAGYTQGIDSVGTAGGSLSATDQFFVQLGVETDGLNYNFGEQPPAGGSVQQGQTAGIGFWNNKNGQALIKAVNGGTGTQLGDWLAATLPNMFGSNAGSSDLAGQGNAAVANLFQHDFLLKGVKLDAQVLATALSVYVTNSTLDSSQVAAGYGFTVSGDGLGTASVNVGSDGAAFGVANNTTMTVMDLLLATEDQAVNGVLYNGNKALRSQANDVYSAVNQAGDIS